ncbi:eIF2 kinase Gcn2p negative regulator [Tulasnella sp. 403]|nr:eIF2 kinase Gcn2p negative regulator [Tulasnella sp. 403]
MADSPDQDLVDFISRFQAEEPERADIASELEALLSIYGENSVRLWPSSRHNADTDASPSDGGSSHGWSPGDKIRFEVVTTLSSPNEDVGIRVLVTLPPTYPVSTPPQVQLLSRYIGDFGVDAGIFGTILRTYISHPGVTWNPGDISVFDGIEFVKSTLDSWYNERLSTRLTQQMRHEESKGHPTEEVGEIVAAPDLSRSSDVDTPLSLPQGIVLSESEPITDRKSVFVGRACVITDPSQVQPIINYLLSDRKIARAAHPVIHAWRVELDGIIHQDNDDDGETAAGARLAHLLQILVSIFAVGITNVLVVVTRYFGGVHLGPDRFKHINASARNAIELAGLLDEPGKKARSSKRK